jgi:hypothetical protein
MEEKELKLTALEMDLIVNVLKQLSVSPGHQDALSIVVTSQSILGKIAQVCKEGTWQQESTT